MNKLSITVIALVLLTCAMPSNAQLAVIDPTNLAQNLLTAARALKQIENQVEQLQNEARMLENEAKNLKHLDYNSLDRLRSTLANTERLFAESRGLAYQLTRAEDQFAQLYPEAYDAAVTRARLDTDSHERWSNSREALSTALEMQAQATENLPEDESVLANLVTASQSADGALQATQATNQLLALQVRQSIQSQQLAIAEDRAIALEHAREVATEARSRELRRRFMNDATTYTAEPVTPFRD
jgi:P-type conjugative transfer protein TrbJ